MRMRMRMRMTMRMRMRIMNRMRILKGFEQFGTIKAKCQMDGMDGWDGMGWDGISEQVHN